MCGADGAGYQMDVRSRKMDAGAFESSHRVVDARGRVLVFVSGVQTVLTPSPSTLWPLCLLARNTPQREHMCCYF